MYPNHPLQITQGRSHDQKNQSFTLIISEVLFRGTVCWKAARPIPKVFGGGERGGTEPIYPKNLIRPGRINKKFYVYQWYTKSVVHYIFFHSILCILASIDLKNIGCLFNRLGRFSYGENLRFSMKFHGLEFFRTHNPENILPVLPDIWLDQQISVGNLQLVKQNGQI